MVVAERVCSLVGSNVRHAYKIVYNAGATKADIGVIALRGDPDDPRSDLLRALRALKLRPRLPQSSESHRASAQTDALDELWKEHMHETGLNDGARSYCFGERAHGSFVVRSPTCAVGDIAAIGEGEGKGKGKGKG